MDSTRLTRDERAAMGDRMRAARYLAGLSLRDVATATGVSVNAVEQWEHGALPQPALRPRLAQLYDQPEEILFAECHARLEAARDLLRPA